MIKKKKSKFFWTVLLFFITISCYAQKEVLPSTFLLDNTFIAANKQKIKRGDNEVRYLFSSVISSAEEAMKHEPYSVTFKSKVPPSGDKRDFMSVGPYWWPDSSKTDGLPYIRKDGVINPERFEIQDAEFFKSLCNDVFLLSLTSYFSDNDKYGNKAVEQLHTWFLNEKTGMNPHLNYGQSIPGITEGRGIGLIDTRSLVYLIDGIQVLKATENLSDEQYKALQSWFKQFLNWMMTSPIGLDEADEHNNHGTYYDVQTVSIALFTGQKELAAEMLEKTTKARIESHFNEDGSQPHELARTLSWNYTVMNLTGFFELSLLAENVHIDLWNYVTPNGKSIKKGYMWFLPYTEGRPWEHKQIKPFNLSSLNRIIRIGSRKYPDIQSKMVVDNDSDDLFELVYRGK